MRKLRIGVAGLGRAYQAMAPAFADPRVEVVAAAETREVPFPGKLFRSVEEMCRCDIDLVYVATPHRFHAEHACIAAQHGKHVLVEKPMAPTLDECRQMIDAARKAGVRLLVGHSHSFDLPIKRTAELIRSGKYGALRMLTALNFTNFLRRRQREASDTVLVNQAPHQVDVARTIAGSEVASVRAARPAEGAYTALLAFAGGACASLSYSGHARFDSDELMDGIGEMGSPRHHQHFGFVVASCELADLRPMPDRILVYGEKEKHVEALPPPRLPRSEVIDELVSAAKPVHDGEWGMATMEVCLAMDQSAREGREIKLRHQPKSA